MRILIVNDGIGDAGGVHVYLDAIVAELAARGHELALAHCTVQADDAGPLACLPRFSVAGSGAGSSVDGIRRWRPDVCYVHNMEDPAAELHAVGSVPVVKFMHGYDSTCVSGYKTHAFPAAEACTRSFGPACAGIFWPRRCGGLSPVTFARDLLRTLSQRRLFGNYGAVVVASDYMRQEYVANGIDPSVVHVNPLFTSNEPDPEPRPVPAEPTVAFLGRMTPLKGGDLLVRAAHDASARLGARITLLMIGDGPARPAWEALARALDVSCTWAGWVTGETRWQLLRGASLVALPSIWPEPFGLVGLEAGALGVPAVATDVGGIREWLRDGTNGVLVASPASPEALGAALARLLGDATHLGRLGAGARRVAAEMTVARHIDRLEPVLRLTARRSVDAIVTAVTAGTGAHA